MESLGDTEDVLLNQEAAIFTRQGRGVMECLWNCFRLSERKSGWCMDEQDSGDTKDIPGTLANLHAAEAYVAVTRPCESP